MRPPDAWTHISRPAMDPRGGWSPNLFFALLFIVAAPSRMNAFENAFLVLERSECLVSARADASGERSTVVDGGGVPCELAGLYDAVERIANNFESSSCGDFSFVSTSAGGWVQLWGGLSGPESLEMYVRSRVVTSTSGFFGANCYSDSKTFSEIHFLWTVDVPDVEIEFRPQFPCESYGTVSAALRLGEQTFDLRNGCPQEPVVVELVLGETVAFDAKLRERDGTSELDTAFSLRVLPNRPLRHQKISDTQGGFTGGSPDRRTFTLALGSLGDLDGDGVGDLAAHRGLLHDAAGNLLPEQNDGGIWILFLNANGTVKSHQIIGSQDLPPASIGATVASLGDVDGDGVVDLATGNNGADDGGADRGAATILFLDSDGTVKSHHRISSTQGGFAGLLSDGDEFAIEVASLGDLDGDSIPDMVAGARSDDDAGTDRGAVWLLFLNADGTVRSQQKISATQGGFTGILDDQDYFGESMASLGDLDGDGVGDLAVAAPEDDDGGTDRGAAWILFLYEDGTVKSHQKISATQGGFTGVLDDYDYFGVSLDSLGDVDGDGVIDLAVGAYRDDDGGYNRGAVWILHLNPDGTVKSHEKISSTRGGFTGILDDGDRFGISVTSLGDLGGGTGAGDLAVNAWRDDDGGPDHGAVWILLLPEPDPTLLLVAAFGALALVHRMHRLRRSAWGPAA